jgi:D-beta-D-heptose 7-phosphate kinase/D-beta-D-heptose 1-phosphate adenosyltransferase
MSNFEPKIILIGEKAVDIVETLTALRSNPEQPFSLVAKPVEKTETGGMAQNVYNNLRALGLEEYEICFISNKTPIIKKRYVCDMTGSVILRIDPNDDVITKNHEYFDGDTFKDLKRVIEGHKTVKMLIVSDYCKGLLSEYWLELIFDLCDKHGVKTAIDSRKKFSKWANKVDFIKINNKEYSELGKDEKCGRNMIVTQGGKGLLWVNENKFYPTKPVNNPVVVGAGDAVLSAFCYKYMLTNDVDQSLKFANAAGRVVVQKRGTATASVEEIERELG